MRCLFVAVAAQRLFQPALRGTPSLGGVLQSEMQAPVVVAYQPVVQQSGWANAGSSQGWIAANPITSCAAVVGLVYLAKNGFGERISALAVSGLAAVRGEPRADVEMSTKYDKAVLNNVGFKKNKKTGDTGNLRGYTVGSRAPNTARNSGTINKFGYGIGNLYGGAKYADKKPQQNSTATFFVFATLAVVTFCALAPQ